MKPLQQYKDIWYGRYTGKDPEVTIGWKIGSYEYDCMAMFFPDDKFRIDQAIESYRVAILEYLTTCSMESCY